MILALKNSILALLIGGAVAACSDPSIAPMENTQKQPLEQTQNGAQEEETAAFSLNAQRALAQLSNKESARVAYSNVDLFDGSGTKLQSDMTIVVHGERIESILPSQDLSQEVLDGAELIDMAGFFAIPGLVDSHVHLATLPAAEHSKGNCQRKVSFNRPALRSAYESSLISLLQNFTRDHSACGDDVCPLPALPSQR